MKTIRTILPLLGLLLVTACAGIKAREYTQIPAMQLAYAKVIQPHVERGLAAQDEPTRQVLAPMVEAFTAAIESGDREQISAQLGAWRDPVRILFTIGLNVRVNARELGPNGAKVLMETAMQFDANMTLLAAR